MIAKLSPDLVDELEQAGDQPLPVENPRTKRVYVIVDLDQFEVVRRPRTPAAATAWTERKNERRCALIRQKFSQGLNAAESKELAELQDQLASYRKQSVPLPYDVVEVLQAALNSSPAAPPPTTP